jgi:hypothetical protein
VWPGDIDYTGPRTPIGPSSIRFMVGINPAPLRPLSI